MDIKKLQAEAAKDENAVTIPINQKGGEPYVSEIDGSQSTVSVLGSESKKYRAARDAISRKVLRRTGRRLEPADILQNRIDLAASVITDWHGWEVDGKPAPCTPENVRAFLAIDHILEQVETGINEHADFFANSSKS